MTSIDRTIYRRMKRSYPTKELIEAYTPTEEERRFVSTMTQTAQNQLNLMIWMKLFPCLGYFSALSEIPAPLVDHIRKALDLAADLIPGYDHDRTLYRHHQLVREYYQIIPYGKDAGRVALRIILRAIRTMDNPADLINAAIDELLKQRYELPAFSTLDRLVGRIHTLIYGHIFRVVNTRMTPSIRHMIERLLEVQTPLHRSTFSQFKLVPQSPTLSHLKAWQDQLDWLKESGSMEPLLKDIPPAIVKHFAAEARAVDTSELQDYTPAKRLTLAACLIHQAQMSTRDDVIEMFLQVLTKHGGQEHVLQQCQEVSASLSDEYQPLVWQFDESHRRAVFELARSLSIRSTTQDQPLIQALTFILSQENRRSLFLPDRLDLSFAPEVWQHLVRVKRRKRTKLVRRHLEVCIFMAVVDELKVGDLAVEGLEQFADFRALLLPWETYELQVADYCQEIGLPADAHIFVAQLRERLTDVAAQVDAGHGLGTLGTGL